MASLEVVLYCFHHLGVFLTRMMCDDDAAPKRKATYLIRVESFDTLLRWLDHDADLPLLFDDGGFHRSHPRSAQSTSSLSRVFWITFTKTPALKKGEERSLSSNGPQLHGVHTASRILLVRTPTSMLNYSDLTSSN
ncbi:hypothetical protein ALC53_10710 [Atta colombica]|uniref:Uncharacterized protein n=1 Tax=Atta colombica TaxID=520822 RepID=A0A151I001_9HYME|nr:hypothetical protein ALC53_10710 [Atta colombica]